MPGPLSGGSMNVGRDLTFTFVVNSQTFRTLGLVTETGRRVVANMHEVVPTNNDGVPVFRVTYAGREYEIHLTRQNGVADALCVALEQNYYSGGTPPQVSALETVRNPDGSVDQTQLLGGAILPESLGAFKGADPVNDVNLKIRFAQAVPVGGGGSAAVNLGTPTSYL